MNGPPVQIMKTGARMRTVTDDGTALWKRGMSPAEKKRVFEVGLPLPYTGYTKDHHPTNMLHIAMWDTSYHEHLEKSGEGEQHKGLSTRRAHELSNLHGAFIEAYFKRMQAQKWANEDGSPIQDALRHILNAFDEWRMLELAKAPNERVCEFNENGIPKGRGSYTPYHDLAWSFFEEYFHGDSASVDMDCGYSALALRDLVPSYNIEEPSYWATHPEELYGWKDLWDHIPGLENDEALLPMGFADYARARRKSEGKEGLWDEPDYSDVLGLLFSDDEP